MNETKRINRIRRATQRLNRETVAIELETLELATEEPSFQGFDDTEMALDELWREF